jgi:hypothetical protein
MNLKGETGLGTGQGMVKTQGEWERDRDKLGGVEGKGSKKKI